MGKYIYTYIENGQMYDESPSLAELLAKEGLICEKIVTGRIEYIKVKDPEVDKMALKKALKAGEVIEGASLVKRQNMQIK